MESTPNPDIARDWTKSAPLSPERRIETTEERTAAADARQDNLMASTSVDGRPPTHKQRSLGWKLIIVGFVLLAVGIATWALVRGASSGTVLGFGAAFVILLLIGGWPVLAAGLFRGSEESSAKRDATPERIELKRSRESAPGVSSV